MVRAEPPTPRRPAAPSPLRPTQRPGAGRPPPAPPPAARGICPRAGPGHRDAELRRHLRADGARCGGRASRDSEGRRSAGTRPGPAPSSGRAGVSTPRRVGRRPRARALEASPCPAPSSALGSPALTVSCGLCAASRRRRFCLSPAPLRLPLASRSAPAGPGHVRLRLGGSSGRARRGTLRGDVSACRPRPSPGPAKPDFPRGLVRPPVRAARPGAGGGAEGRGGGGSCDHPFLRSHAGPPAATSVPGS